jgi:hypothetical protein
MRVAKEKRNALDLNGDGRVDYKDAIVATKIAGAAVVGAGTALAAGAYSGALVVSGTASTIATGIVATAGASVGAFTGAILGATSTTFMAVKTASGAVVIASEAAVTFTPQLVAAFSGVSAMNSMVVAKIAGLPVIQSLAVEAAISKGSTIVIGGVPILREAALAAGLISLLIVGGYAYVLLNENEVEQ